MGKRTNTAQWNEKRQHWYIAVQKDGIRKFFYSSKQGREGQREANRKADAWLDDGLNVKASRVDAVYLSWLESLKQTTSAGNYEPIESRWRVWVLPYIGKKRVNALSDADLQAIINRAYTEGKSKKTLQLLAGDLRSFCKYCRKAKLSTFFPEDIQIPAGARLKGKTVLQPADLQTLFTVDSTLYRGKRVHDDYINAYRFQVLTGLRPGELLGLHWADIKGDSVNLSRAINVKGQETRGKNENAVRSFVLTDVAKAVLEAQRAITGNFESVFCLESERRYYKRWKVYCNANDLQPVSLYELRHTFVSVVKTLPAGEVKTLVGHSQNMDTFGQYSHALTGEAEKTAKAVNAAFMNLLNTAL